MDFQNIYTFTYQKAVLDTILLLGFKIAKSLRCILKDAYREKAPSNKTPAFIKSRSMGIWVIGTLN